jgi:hypothetical protein
MPVGYRSHALHPTRAVRAHAMDGGDGVIVDVGDGDDHQSATRRRSYHSHGRSVAMRAHPWPVTPTSSNAVNTLPPAPTGTLPAAASTPCASTATAKPPSEPRQASHRADHDLVLTTRTGGSLDAANVRRDSRRLAAAAGPDAADWSPRELRHSFVSLLSDEGVPVEQMAQLVDHTGGSSVTETGCRSKCGPSSMTAPLSWTASSTPQS